MDEKELELEIRKFKRRDLLALMSVVLFIPMGFVVAYLSSVFKIAPESLMIAYFLFMGFCVVQSVSNICPKCQEPYYMMKSGFLNPIGKKCCRCGFELKKGKDKNA